MGDTVYLDSQGLPEAVEAAIAGGLHSLVGPGSPLLRAAWVFELQEVERRCEALGDPVSVDQGDTAVVKSLEALWRRRCELTGLLWPSVISNPDAPIPAVPSEGLRKVPS